MNVTELSRQVKVPTTKLLEILPQLGFDIGKKAIKVDDRVARDIFHKFQDPRVREKFLGEGGQKLKTVKEMTTPLLAGQSRIVEVGDTITVKELAIKLNVPVTRLILQLMKNGVMASINERVDFETALLIAADFGFEVKKEAGGEKVDWEKEKEERTKIFGDEAKNLSPRPPVVVVMGHVDHGKTKLLDAIRSTDVVSGEAGGITQHIGAYQVVKNGQQITFIDTPGHEAFSAMRSRGAAVADLAILVVAADDGVQPQTIEALSLIRSAGLPFVVAINKIDKPDANVDKIKTALSEMGVAPEDWGGKTICVEISAKEKINIDGLLDTLILVYEMEKEKIQGNPNRAAVGTIIEARLDKGLGPVATCIVQTGTLNRGDVVKIGQSVSKIRALKNWHGAEVEKATPSMPVRILGLKAVPLVGDILSEVSDKKEIRQLLKMTDQNKHRLMKREEVNTRSVNKDENGEEKETGANVNLVLKADVLGSVEAILEALTKLENKGVKIKVVKQGLGNINEGDIEQAKNLGADVIGFHNKIMPEAETMAANLGVEVKISPIIYELLDFVAEKVKALTKTESVVKSLGKGRVIKIFRTEKKAQLVGVKIWEGKAIPAAEINVVHGETVVAKGKALRIQCGKENMKEVVEGEECGISVEGTNVIKEGDILEFYVVEEK
ncbi:MAG: translation initiation factor IF-2 [Patescibacteria group bacterium]|nr:translation initiation factor IF-2 [Patescibacteria group bacterium]